MTSGGICPPPLVLLSKGESMREDMNKALDRLNLTIAECEELREEWKQRIKEVDDLKDTYETLINLLRKQLKIEDGT